VVIPRSNFSEFGIDGFTFEINDIGTYHIYGFDSIHQVYYYNFIIIIFKPSEGLAIPGFPLIWFYAALLLGRLFLTFVISYKKDDYKSLY
jgi:hypothetical protein